MKIGIKLITATLTSARKSTSMVKLEEMTATKGRVIRALRFHVFKFSFIEIIK
jgi:hypothetical protein